MSIARLYPSLLLAAVLLATAGPVCAQERVTRLGGLVYVARESSIKDVVCLFCRIEAQGDVRGNLLVIGGAALALLGIRRYGFNRPPLLGPSGQLVATGATVFMGYPFLRGA